MTTMLATPTTTLRRADLTVERTDIRFFNETAETVVIEITVRNRGTGPSAATEMRIEAAPLGAFVPWRPLKTVDVPPIGPGDEVTVRTTAQTGPPPLAITPQRLTARRLLTALDLEDRRTSRENRGRFLSTDLMKMVGCGGVHWVGNLNVFIGGKAVERHMAPLRIHPGRVNMAMFLVGSRSDTYAMTLEGDVEWEVILSRSMLMPNAKRDDPGVIEPGQWFRTRRKTPVMLAMKPPADAEAGSLVVNVVQQSTGKEAKVEFSLDANAAGPGCYVV